MAETTVDTITATEAARLLGVAPKTLRRQTALGRVPGRRVGRHYKYSRETIQRLLTTCTPAGEGAAHA